MSYELKLGGGITLSMLVLFAALAYASVSIPPTAADLPTDEQEAVRDIATLGINVRSDNAFG